MNKHTILAAISDLENTTAKLQALVAGPAHNVTPYSQNDPRWKSDEYAGGTTFGRAGCYVVCVAMIVGDDPRTVAENLRNAGCFTGNLLTKPQNIPNAYSDFRYDGTHRWHDTAADMDKFRAELERGPVITEVDFKPGGEFNQHFVVCLELDKDDILILDPWTGTERYLLETYSVIWQHWNLARAIYGMRLLRAV